eukprot:1155504-Pelagomonas_calceolata.AAC.3
MHARSHFKSAKDLNGNCLQAHSHSSQRLKWQLLASTQPQQPQPLSENSLKQKPGESIQPPQSQPRVPQPTTSTKPTAASQQPEPASHPSTGDSNPS